MMQLTRRQTMVSTLAVMTGPSLAFAAGPPASTTASVTLIIFSGRLDPTWTLTAVQTEEFRNRMAALPPARDLKAPAARLGYTGFGIMFSDESRRFHDIRVWRGFATWGITKTERQLLDPERGLEAWLLETAGDALDPALKEIVRKDLRGR